MEWWKITLICVCLIAVAFGSFFLVQKASCNQFAYLNPYEEFRYSPWNGCLIRWNSLWMPYEAIIIR